MSDAPATQSEFEIKREKTRAAIKTAAKNALIAMNAELAKLGEDLGPRMKANVLAEIIADFEKDPRCPSFQYTDWAMGARIGAMVEAQIPDYERVHSELKRRGITRDNAIDLGGNCGYAYPIFDSQDRRAFCIETQNMNLLILLQSRYDGTDVHIRRWWDSLPEKRLKGHLVSHEKKFQAEKNKDYAHVVALADAAAEYSDNLPGKDYVHRPDLSMFIETEFKVKCEGACPGLRYGDSRDRGYILTTKKDYLTDKLLVDSPVFFAGTLNYAMISLVSLCDTLNDLPDPEPRTNRREAGSKTP